MRRLASLAAVLAVAAAPTARAEQLDLDLTRLGPPAESAWADITGTSSGAAELARDARRRFGILSSELALALSQAVLQPAGTTGHSSFAIDLETATAAVHAAPVGTTAAGFRASPWPTLHAEPSRLLLPSLHMRKGLPFSLELGGRLIYLGQSNYFAAQGEGKWALNEGIRYAPDVAVRGAYTRLFGVRDLTLATVDLDLLVSKRFALMGVMGLTPYLVARYTHVSSYSGRMDFAPLPATSDPVARTASQAAFPRFSTGYYRGTLGLRFTTYSVSLAVEGTYFPGATRSPSDDYQQVKVASSLGGAFKLGWEF